MSAKIQRLLDEANTIIDRSGNNPSKSDLDRLHAIRAEVEAERHPDRVEARAKGDALIAGLKSLGDYGPSNNGTTRFLDLKGAVRGITHRGERPLDAKSLIAAGTSVSAMGFTNQPVQMGGGQNELLDVIPVVESATTYSYLRQNSRSWQASVVAAGAEKPTSTMGLTRVEDRLRVVATLSEPIDKYMIADNASLSTFVESELMGAVAAAVTEQILHGDGTGESFTGLTEADGTTPQSFDTSLLLTLRRAVGALERLGESPKTFVLSAADWEDLEVSQLTSGAYALPGGPVDRAARRVWGVDVVISTAVADGEGFLLGEGAIELRTDGQVVTDVDASTGFSTNEIAFRTESRFNLALLRPAAVVVIETAEPDEGEPIVED